MLAAKSGKSDLVTALLEFDAKVDDKDATGNTAEDYANDKKKILECLKRFDKSHKPVTSFPSKVEKDADLPSETENDQFGLPFAVGGSPRLGDIDETLQKDDFPASDLSTWDDSVPSSPLPGQGSQLVKFKGMFDLSKFMVGSDKESIKSDNSIKLNSLDKNIHNSDRKDSATPPPKPPRIYDTVEGHTSLEENIYDLPCEEVEEVVDNPNSVKTNTEQLVNRKAGAQFAEGSAIGDHDMIIDEWPNLVTETGLTKERQNNTSVTAEDEQSGGYTIVREDVLVDESPDNKLVDYQNEEVYKDENESIADNGIYLSL